MKSAAEAGRLEILCLFAAFMYVPPGAGGSIRLHIIGIVLFFLVIAEVLTALIEFFIC